MKKIALVDHYELPVSVAKDEDGFLASCPVWDDCYAQGDTIDEALSEISSVAASLVELYKEEGLKIPLKVKKRAASSQKVKVELPLLVSTS